MEHSAPNHANDDPIAPILFTNRMLSIAETNAPIIEPISTILSECIANSIWMTRICSIPMTSTNGDIRRSGVYAPSNPSPTMICKISGPATRSRTTIGKENRNIASNDIDIFCQYSFLLPSDNRHDTRGNSTLVKDARIDMMMTCNFVAVVKYPTSSVFVAKPNHTALKDVYIFANKKYTPINRNG
jgi:hypothetical protein